MIEQIAQALQQAETIKKAAFRLGASIFLGALVLAGALLQATRMFTAAKNSIYVKGVADTLVKADRVVWRGSFSARNAAYVQAVLLVEKDRARVRRFLVSSGVDSLSIVFQAVNT